MQTTLASEVYRIEMWATAYYQVVVLDVDVACLLGRLGFDTNRNEYFQDHEHPSGVPDRIYTGSDVTEILRLLDKENLHYIVKPCPKPEFHSETWRRLNRIRHNDYSSK